MKSKEIKTLWKCPKCAWQWKTDCSEYELFAIGMLRSCPKGCGGRIKGKELSKIMGYDVDKSTSKGA